MVWSVIPPANIASGVSRVQLGTRRQSGEFSGFLFNTSLLHSNKEFIQKITLDKFEMKTMFEKRKKLVVKYSKKLYRDFSKVICVKLFEEWVEVKPSMRIKEEAEQFQNSGTIDIVMVWNTRNLSYFSHTWDTN